MLNRVIDLIFLAKLNIRLRNMLFRASDSLTIHSFVHINWIIRKKNPPTRCGQVVKLLLFSQLLSVRFAFQRVHFAYPSIDYFDGKILRLSKFFPTKSVWMKGNSIVVSLPAIFASFITEWVEFFSVDLWVINMVQRPRENEISVKSECKI